MDKEEQEEAKNDGVDEEREEHPEETPGEDDRGSLSEEPEEMNIGVTVQDEDGREKINRGNGKEKDKEDVRETDKVGEEEVNIVGDCDEERKEMDWNTGHVEGSSDTKKCLSGGDSNVDNSLGAQMDENKATDHSSQIQCEEQHSEPSQSHIVEIASLLSLAKRAYQGNNITVPSGDDFDNQNSPLKKELLSTDSLPAVTNNVTNVLVQDVPTFQSLYPPNIIEQTSNNNTDVNPNANPASEVHSAKYGIKSFLESMTEPTTNNQKVSQKKKVAEEEPPITEDRKPSNVDSRTEPIITNISVTTDTGSTSSPQHSAGVLDKYDLGGSEMMESSNATAPTLFLCGQYLSLSSDDNEVSLHHLGRKRKRYVESEDEGDRIVENKVISDTENEMVTVTEGQDTVNIRQSDQHFKVCLFYNIVCIASCLHSLRPFKLLRLSFPSQQRKEEKMRWSLSALSNSLMMSSLLMSMSPTDLPYQQCTL